jgi:methionyl-tRNA formyltransferase
LEDKANYAPGQVIKVDRNGFHVACLTQALLVKEVQPEAGKLMPANSFVAGYKITPGFSF